MIINHNIAALNTNRQLAINNGSATSSLKKLSSGYRINSAADDAAGLAISEKMRGQIRGLDQASRNAQDGISLIQTAEGALSETESILQRMKELATQAANGTNTESDRSEIQKEINQLTSEVNRIGNTTEFNTQSLLKGDGAVNLDLTKLVTDGALIGGVTTKTAASQATTFTDLKVADNGKTATWTLNGQQVTVKFVSDTTMTDGTASVDASSVTGNSVTIKFNNSDGTKISATTAGNAISAALTGTIGANSVLKNNYSATNVAGAVTVAAVAGGSFDGKDGAIAAVTFSAALASAASGGLAAVGTTTYTQASKTIAFASLENTDAATTNQNLKALVGTGFTVNGQEIEFYNSDDGAYTGDAIGVSISAALATAAYTSKADTLASTIAATVGSQVKGVNIAVDTTTDSIKITDSTFLGADGNNKIGVADGGVQKDYMATFQIGANSNQSMTIAVNDMRSLALNICGITASATITAHNGKVATLQATMGVTNGTNNTDVEFSLDVSTYDHATGAISVLDDAIASVSAERSKLGAYQNRLEHTINNLGTSSENLSSAESRIRDVDMASEYTNYTKLNILSQAATAMLAQANQMPQTVLQLLR